MTAPHVVDPAELTSVRDALLQIARADAEAVLADADRETAELLASAEAEVAELLDRARARSREEAAELVAAQHSRMLREARSFELAARRSAYDALVAAAVVAVRARLADDPEVLAALTARAHAELGPDATVTSSPDGGLVAEADGRRMGLPLTALAERAVTELLLSRGTP
jgi:vacuolar-type H+-ATPase subunit E/Vma4